MFTYTFVYKYMKYMYIPPCIELNDDTLNFIRTHLKNVALTIIQEISMISNT